MSGRVLITGARAPAALDLVRAFAAAGYEAHLADCRTVWSARLSRTPTTLRRYASPVHHPERFATDIADLVDRLNPDLIVPVCEEVFHLARLAVSRSDLATLLAAPPLETLTTLHSKRRFVALCETLGIDAPRTWSLTGRDALTDLPDPSTLVFKPEFSRFGLDTLIRPSRDRLAELQPTAERPWVAQSYVAGAEVCFHAVARDGRLTAFSSYRSSWRTRGGAGYAFAPVERATHEALRGAAERLSGPVGRGQFACDAIIGPDGRPWLIECNPRATSGVHLFDRAPALARAFTDDGPCLDIADFAPRHIGPALWLLGLPAALKAGRLSDWRDARRQGRDVVTAAGDVGPLAGALIDGASFGIEACLSGRPLAGAMTADIEWNGAAA